MALFPTNYTLTQGSLHYRLATLGYQKRNTDGVETFILYSCSRFLAFEFMADCAEKAQHRWRCSPQNIREPRVAYTIVWQPWAIKSATPTALECAFYILVHIFSRLNLWRIALRKHNTYGVVPYKPYVNPG